MESLKIVLYILLCIAVPAILIGIAVVSFLHYRTQKREATIRAKRLAHANQLRAKNAHLEPTEELEELPELLPSNNPGQMIHKYRMEVKMAKEKHAMLKQEFAKLEERYTEVVMERSQENKLTHNTPADDMVWVAKEQEYLAKIGSLKHALAKAENLPSVIVETEASNWKSLLLQKEDQVKQQELKMAELKQELRAYHLQTDSLFKELEEAKRGSARSNALLFLENDNSALVEQLQEKLKKIEQEKSTLQSQLTDESSFQELLEEKNAHITFLQSQLEQRAKNHRQVEQQRQTDTEAVEKMQSLLKQQELELANYKDEIMQKEVAVLEIKERLQYNNRQTDDQKEKAKTSIARVASLEKSIEDLNQQKVQMEKTIMTSNTTIGRLNQSLFQQNEQIEELEKKLDMSSQMLVKIYKDLARSFGTTILTTIGQERLNDKDPAALLHRPGSNGETPLVAFND
jgi:hypothetical protein